MQEKCHFVATQQTDSHLQPNASCEESSRQCEAPIRGGKFSCLVKVNASRYERILRLIRKVIGKHTSMSSAIVLKGVTKTFGKTKAVADLNLEIPRGALYGFIGPNGAGKTTSIRMIMSILFPDQGEISILGFGSAMEAKDRIGYLPEERGLYRKMRVGAFLVYMSKLKGVVETGIQKRIENSLESVGLGGTFRKRCEELSKGMMQKVQFLAATIHQPDLLILDEPFTGLDPVSARLLRDLVRAEHKRGATILFSTHVMLHAEEICDTVVMVHQGRKVLDERIEKIRRQYDPRRIQFDPLDPDANISPLQSLPEVERLSRVNGGYEILLVEGTDPAAAMKRIVQTVTPARLEVSRPKLEDIFIKLVLGKQQTTESIEELRASLTDIATKAAAL
jgi:ABC-2 type transport system ATP-binding protein